jgi:hypothetical protein
VHRYSWSLDFSRDAYLKLLSTYSFCLTMEESGESASSWASLA